MKTKSIIKEEYNRILNGEDWKRDIYHLGKLEALRWVLEK